LTAPAQGCDDLLVVPNRRLAIVRGRVYTALSVLSLLLCAATLALWVRSHFVYDIVGYNSWTTYSVAGRLLVIWRGFDGTSHDWFRGPPSSDLGRAVRTSLGASSFSFDRYSHPFAIKFPHWSLALLLAMPPALRFRAATRERRIRRAGHCPNCGYDLRATPDRCPECGAVPPAAR
jgi:hypothetical protein